MGQYRNHTSQRPENPLDKDVERIGAQIRQEKERYTQMRDNKSQE